MSHEWRVCSACITAGQKSAQEPAAHSHQSGTRAVPSAERKGVGSRDDARTRAQTHARTNTWVPSKVLIHPGNSMHNPFVDINNNKKTTLIKRNWMIWLICSGIPLGGEKEQQNFLRDMTVLTSFTLQRGQIFIHSLNSSVYTFAGILTVPHKLHMTLLSPK